MRTRIDIRWYVIEVEDIDLLLHQWERRGKCERVDLWRPAKIVRRLVDGDWWSKTEELFPGYLLAKCPEGPQTIERTMGVKILKRGKQYSPLTNEEVARIKEKTQFEMHEVDYQLETGQCVEFRPDARSPYAGLEGVYMGHVLGTMGYFARVAIWLWERTGIKVVPYDHLIPCGITSGYGQETKGKGKSGKFRLPTGGKLTSIQPSRTQTEKDYHGRICARS